MREEKNGCECTRADVALWKNSTEASEGQYHIVGIGQSAARGGGHSARRALEGSRTQRRRTHRPFPSLRPNRAAFGVAVFRCGKGL